MVEPKNENACVGMKLSDLFRVLSGKKKRKVLRVTRKEHSPHGQIELQRMPIDLHFDAPPERPEIQAKPIQVQGTFGRNAVDPPRKRRR